MGMRSENETEKEEGVDAPKEETKTTTPPKKEKTTPPKKEKPKPAEKAVTTSSGGGALMKPTMGAGNLALDVLVDAFDPVDWGVLAQVKVNNGVIFDKDKNKYGTEMEVTIMSTRIYTQIQNGMKKKDLILRSTYDDINLANPLIIKTGEIDEDGDDITENITTVEELEAYFVEQGWKRKMKRDPRMEMIVEVLDAETDNENIGNIVAMDLSKMSIKEFDRYKFQGTVKVRAGKITEEQLSHATVTVKDKTGGDFDYNVFGFAMTV